MKVQKIKEFLASNQVPDAQFDVIEQTYNTNSGARIVSVKRLTDSQVFTCNETKWYLGGEFFALVNKFDKNFQNITLRIFSTKKAVETFVNFSIDSLEIYLAFFKEVYRNT